MNLIYTGISTLLLFIAGLVTYTIFETTEAIIWFALLGTAIITIVLLALHSTRKSYIRFTVFEIALIAIVLYLSFIFIQNELIMFIN